MKNAFLIMIDSIKQQLKYIWKNIATIMGVFFAVMILSTFVMLFQNSTGVSGDTYKRIILTSLWYDDITKTLISYIEDDGVLSFDEYNDIIRLVDLKKDR